MDECPELGSARRALSFHLWVELRSVLIVPWRRLARPELLRLDRDQEDAIGLAMGEERSSPGETIRDRFWIVGPIGLLLAFFWQPALRLIPPFVLTAVASLLVVALILLERATRARLRRAAIILYAWAVVLGALGFGEGFYFAGQALTISDANDERCLRIERHMLGAPTGRAADAELFQALGCRPQTVEPARWPPAP